MGDYQQLVNAIRSLDPDWINVPYAAATMARGAKLDNPAFDSYSFFIDCGLPSPILGRQWLSLPEGMSASVEGLMKGKKGAPFIIIYQPRDETVVIDLTDENGLEINADPDNLLRVRVNVIKQKGLKAASSDITLLD